MSIKPMNLLYSKYSKTRKKITETCEDLKCERTNSFITMYSNFHVFSEICEIIDEHKIQFGNNLPANFIDEPIALPKTRIQVSPWLPTEWPTFGSTYLQDDQNQVSLLTGCEIDLWRSIIRSAWYQCVSELSADSSNLIQVDEATHFVNNLANRLQNFKASQLFPALSPANCKSLIWSSSSYNCNESQNQLNSLIECWYRFFYHLIHAHFGGIRSPPFHKHLSTILNKKKRTFVIACFGLLIQLTFKTGRLKLIFTQLCWLYQLIKDSKAYDSTSADYTNTEFSRNSMAGFNNCLAMLREAVFLNKRHLNNIRVSLIDFSIKLDYPTPDMVSSSNMPASKLSSTLTELRQNITQCFDTLTELASLQNRIWQTYLKFPNLTVPAKDIHASSSPLSSRFFLLQAASPTSARPVPFNSHPETVQTSRRHSAPIMGVASDWVFIMDSAVNMGRMRVSFFHTGYSFTSVTDPNQKVVFCRPTMRRNRGVGSDNDYCVCPKAYQTSHKIAHLTAHPNSRLFILITACSRLFAWLLSPPVCDGSQSSSDRKKVENKNNEDSSISQRIERIAAMFGAKETVDDEEVHEHQDCKDSNEENDGEEEADWPMMQIDLREWFLRQPQPETELDSSAFAPRVTTAHLIGISGGDQLALATSTGIIYICQLTFASGQLHPLYTLQKPITLLSMTDSRIEAVTSSSSCSTLALWHSSATGNSSVEMNGFPQSSNVGISNQSKREDLVRQPPAKSSLIIYAGEEIVEEVISCRRIVQVVAIADLIAILNEDGEVYTCFVEELQSYAPRTNLTESGVERDQRSSAWTRHLSKARWITTTYPEPIVDCLPVASQSSIFAMDPSFHTEDILPGIVISTSPTNGTWYAGGSILHVSAVDQTVTPLTWIDNSMPCGLQSLAFVSPMTCITYHNVPPLKGGLSPNSFYLPILHPFTAEVSSETVNLLISTIEDGFEEIRQSGDNDDMFSIVFAAVELLNLQLLVANSRQYNVSPESGKKILSLLSSILVGTSSLSAETCCLLENVSLSCSARLHEMARQCLTSGWPLFAPSTAFSLVDALQTALAPTPSLRINSVINLLLSSLITHFGYTDSTADQTPAASKKGDKVKKYKRKKKMKNRALFGRIVDVSNEGSVRFHELFREQMDGLPDEEENDARSSVNPCFPLLSKMTSELFTSAETGFEQNPSTETKQGGSLSDETLDHLLRLVLMTQQELVKYIFLLSKKQIEENHSSSGLTRFASAMCLLEAHCHHVFSSALHLLSYTATTEEEEDRLLKGLSMCHGLTVCLPQLIQNLIWLQQQSGLPPITRSDFADDLLCRLDAINTKFSDHIIDRYAIAVDSERNHRFRVFKRTVATYSTEFLLSCKQIQQRFATTNRTAKIPSLPIVINGRVYNLDAIKDTHKELVSSLFDCNELDVTKQFNSMCLSSEQRLALASCYMGILKYPFVLNQHDKFYSLEALLMVHKVQYISMILNKSDTANHKWTFDKFKSFSGYRHLKLPHTEEEHDKQLVEQTNESLVNRFMDLLFNDPTDINVEQPVLLSLLKSWLHSHLPFPQNSSGEINVHLQGAVIVTMAAMLYHTATLHLIAAELSCKCQPDLNVLLRYMPALSKFVTNIVRSHQIEKISYEETYMLVNARCRLLCYKLEPIYARPVGLFTYTAAQPSSSAKPIVTSKSAVDNNDTEIEDAEKDMDETCYSSSISPSGGKPVGRWCRPPTSRWQWARHLVQHYVISSSHIDPWTLIYTAIKDPSTKVFLLWIHSHTQNDAISALDRLVIDTADFALARDVDNNIFDREAKQLAMITPDWKKAKTELTPLLFAHENGTTDTGKSFMNGITTMSVACLLCEYCNDSTPIANNILSHMIGEEFLKKLAHLPSWEAVSLDEQRTACLHSLIVQLRELIFEAEDILLIGKCVHSRINNNNGETDDVEAVPLCLEDLPQAKPIALCLHLLAEGLLNVSNEGSTSPLIFSPQCNSTMTPPGMLDTFISLMQTVKRLAEHENSSQLNISFARQIRYISQQFILTIARKPPSEKTFLPAFRLLKDLLQVWIKPDIGNSLTENLSMPSTIDTVTTISMALALFQAADQIMLSNSLKFNQLKLNCCQLVFRIFQAASLRFFQSCHQTQLNAPSTNALFEYETLVLSAHLLGFAMTNIPPSHEFGIAIWSILEVGISCRFAVESKDSKQISVHASENHLQLDPNKLNWGIEETVLLMRRLLFEGDIIKTKTWWIDGGLRDGLMVRLLHDNSDPCISNRLVRLATVSAFLAGVDERPYPGGLVNYAVDAADTQSGMGVVTARVEENSDCKETPTRKQPCFRILPLAKHQSVAASLFQDEKSELESLRQFVSALSSDEFLQSCNKDFKKCGIFGSIDGTIVRPISSAVRVVLFPNPLARIIQLEKHGSSSDLLRELSQILVAIIVSDDAKLLAPSDRYSELCQSSGKTALLVCSMYLRVLHGLIRGFLADHPGLTVMGPGQETEPPANLASLVDFLRLGIPHESGELWLLKHIFMHALRPKMSLPRLIRHPGIQCEDTCLKNVYLSLEEALLAKSYTVGDIAGQNINEADAICKKKEPFEEELTSRFPLTIRTLLQMGFALREILLAVEHLGGPSPTSMLERASSENTIWPRMPEIESCVDVMLLISPESPAPPPQPPRLTDSRSSSWLEELRGITGLRPPPTTPPPQQASQFTFNVDGDNVASVDDQAGEDEDDFHFGDSAGEFRAAFDELMAGGSVQDEEVEESRPEDRVSDETTVCEFGVWPPRASDLMHIPSMSSSDSDSARSGFLQRRPAQIFNRNEVRRALINRRSARRNRLNVLSNTLIRHSSAGRTPPPVRPFSPPTSFSYRPVSSARSRLSHTVTADDYHRRHPNGQESEGEMLLFHREQNSLGGRGDSPLRGTSSRLRSRSVSSSRQNKPKSPLRLSRFHTLISPTNLSPLTTQFFVRQQRSRRFFSAADHSLPSSSLPRIQIRDKVTIIAEDPIWGWGQVTRGSVGEVTDTYFVNRNFKFPRTLSETDQLECGRRGGTYCIVQIRFPTQLNWIGLITEVAPVTATMEIAASISDTVGEVPLNLALTSSSASSSSSLSIPSLSMYEALSSPLLPHFKSADWKPTNGNAVSDCTISDVWSKMSISPADCNHEDRIWLHQTIANSVANEDILAGWRAERELLLGMTEIKKHVETEEESPSLVYEEAYTDEARRFIGSRVRRWLASSRLTDSDDCPKDSLILSSSEPDELISDRKLRDATGCVYVWGLNDKDQLGGPRGSKVKLPLYNPTLSALKSARFAGGSKCLFIVTERGEVYACGDSSGGKLGISDLDENIPTVNISQPRIIETLKCHRVVKVAVHSGSRHALALTSEGYVFAWGDGASGQLGLGSRASMKTPQQITSKPLAGICIVDVAIGSGYSAAITANGELFTWGLGKSGRLGHGDMEDRLIPTKVQTFDDYQVVQVACGSRDAQTLALTSDGNVWAWGDGDFGKLGLGHTESLTSPTLLQAFVSQPPVIFLGCGAQFSVALNSVGRVFTWGKADYYRLGHGDLTHVFLPAVVRTLCSQRIVQVAVGALHCLAVADNGRVHAWGDNDHGQLGNGLTQVNKMPSPVIDLVRLGVAQLEEVNYQVACGSSHSIAFQVHHQTATTHLAALFDAAHSLSCETPRLARRFQPPCLPFPDAPVGIMGRIYTQLALKVSINSNAEVMRILNEVGIDKWKPKWQPVPYRVPVRDPLGFSYLGLVDNYTDETGSSSQPSDRLRHKIASLTSPCSSPSPRFMAEDREEDVIGETSFFAPPLSTTQTVSNKKCHSFICPPKIDFLYSIVRTATPIAVGCSLMPSPLEQRIRWLAAYYASPVEFTHLARLMLQFIRTDVARDVTHLLLFWMCFNSKPDTSKTDQKTKKKAEAVLKSKLNENLLFSDTPTNLKFTDWLDERTLLHWIDLVHLQLTAHYDEHQGGDGALLESSWPAAPGEPISSSNDALLRLHFAWLSTSLTQSPPHLRRLINRLCLIDLDDASCRRGGNLADRGVLFVGAKLGSTKSVSVLPDSAALISPSLLFVQACLVSGLVGLSSDAYFIETSLNWLVNLARLAFCSAALTNTDALSSCSQSATEELSWHKREWALGALLHVVKSNSSTLGKDLRRQMFRLGGASEDEISLEKVEEHLLSNDRKNSAFQWDVTKSESTTDHSTIFVSNDCTKHKPALTFMTNCLLECLPTLIHQQFEYERPHVEEGNQFNHSRYLLRMILLAVELGLNEVPLIKKLSLVEETQAEERHWSKSLLVARPCQPLNGAVCLSQAPSTPSRVKLDKSAVKKMPLLRQKVNWDWFTRLARCLSSLDALILGQASQSGFGISLPSTVECTDLKLFGILEDTELLQWIRQHPDDWEDCWPHCCDQVLAWGQNDSGQLGGLEGRAVRTPCLVERLGEVGPISLVAGLLTLFAITENGKVFASGYACNDRLGVSIDNFAYQLVPVTGLSQIHIVKVTVHSCGQHCLALDVDGNVYSWGTQTHGRLGHGGVIYTKGPRCIETLRPNSHPPSSADSMPFRVIDVFAGYAHSAVVTDSGVVYTWGHGLTGSLGHGDFVNQRRPKSVEALKGHRITEVACAGEITPVLALEPGEDTIWQWGNTSFSKADSTQHACRPLFEPLPTKMEALQGLGIIHLTNGGNFSMALSSSGAVYTWGIENKGALGHCILESVPLPKRVLVLAAEFIVSVSCGYSHCLACNDKGELFTWGANDHGQLGDGSTISTPFPHKLPRFGYRQVNQIVCGSSHSFVLLKDAYASTQLPSEPLPARPPPMHFHKIAEEIPLKVGVQVNSVDHLRLLRNRFLFLYVLAKEVCGGEIINLRQISLPTSSNDLVSMRLQSSACFGFWPLVSHSVGDGLMTGRLATLLSPSRVQQDLTAFDVRLDILSSLLITSSKELLLKRYLQYTTHPTLFHGPEIRISRMSLALSRQNARQPPIEISDPLQTVFAQVSRHMLQVDEYGTPNRKSKTAAADTEAKRRRRANWLSCQLTEGAVTWVPRPPAMQVPPQPHFWLAQRTWKVSLVGESVDDCGGGFSDCIAELCDELQATWSSLPVLCSISSSTDNESEQSLPGSKSFIVNPDCALLAPNWLVFLGCLMGFAVRTGHSLHLRLLPSMWRLLATRRAGIRLVDLISLEAEFADSSGFDLISIAKMTKEELKCAEIPFICLSANRNHSINLLPFVRELFVSRNPLVDDNSLRLLLANCPDVDVQASHLADTLWPKVHTSAQCTLDSLASNSSVLVIDINNRLAYLLASLIYRRQEFEPAIRLIRRGLAQVLPISLLSLFSGDELECLVCGVVEISIPALKQLVTYDNLSVDEPLVQWFWTIVTEMTDVERSLLLRFIWGRSRLPRFPSDLRERQFHIRVQLDYIPADSYLPEGSTCMFTLRIPNYSSLEKFRGRLLYAIHTCRTIDSDDLAVFE